MSKNNKCLPGNFHQQLFYTNINNHFLQFSDLGYECSEEENDCIITNAKCTNKKCECVDGYLKLDKRICIKSNSVIFEQT